MQMSQIDIASIEYDCWHEAGHAVVCLLSGGSVACMEIIKNQEQIGRARARCQTTNSTRKYIACGGFAAECLLFRLGVLKVSEKEFIQRASVNAFPDKIAFYGKDYDQKNGCWPRHMDEHSRDFSIKKVQPMLINNLCLLAELAKTLPEKEAYRRADK